MPLKTIEPLEPLEIDPVADITFPFTLMVPLSNVREEKGPIVKFPLTLIVDIANTTLGLALVLVKAKLPAMVKVPMTVTELVKPSIKFTLLNVTGPGVIVPLADAPVGTIKLTVVGIVGSGPAV